MGGATEKQQQQQQQAPGEGAAAATVSAEASTSGGGRERGRARSLVDDQGVYSSTCGYCHRPSRSSVAHGLSAYILTVWDYQELLDRGWRRSGMFLYKPRMKKTCCPSYTIRLKANLLVASKDQKRVLKRMQRYLDGTLDDHRAVEELHKKTVDSSDGEKRPSNDMDLASASMATTSSCNTGLATGHLDAMDMPRPADDNDGSGPPVAKEGDVANRLKTEVEAALRNCVETGMLPLMSDLPVVGVKRLPQRVKGKLKYEEGEVDYTSSISFAVVACLRRRKHGVQGLENVETVIPDLKPQNVAEMLAAQMSNQSGFASKASNGYINFVPVLTASSSKPSPPESQPGQNRTARKNSVGDKSQPRIQSMSEPSAVERRLDIELKRSSFDAQEFALYKKYQVRVHNDRPEDVRETSYRRFLVDSPLIFVPPTRDGTTPPCGFGSFHQRYLIDGKLVAVGVIDILPQCLSSKYLFWDPDMAFLALGKYSALQEINWVQEAQKICPSLQYYYLGFYIHSCPKMRYKAGYHPSELLCPERFRWVPYKLCIPYLDKQPYVSLSDIMDGLSVPAECSSPGLGSEKKNLSPSSPDDEDDNDGTATEIDAEFAEMDDQEMLERSLETLFEKDVPWATDVSNGPLDCILLSLNGACLSFKRLRELAIIPQWQLETLAHNLNTYLQVVGPSLASRMTYALSS